MSANLNTYVSCPALQSALMPGDFVPFDPTENRYVPPFTRFLVSQANRGSISQMISSGRGRHRQVQLTYMPRMLESEVSDTITTDCTSGSKEGETSTTYSIDTEVGSEIKRTLALSDIEDNCKDDEYFVAKYVNRMIDVLVRNINRKNIIEAASLFGNHADTGSSAAVTGATKLSSGEWTDDFVNKISYELAKSEIAGVPTAAFGGSRDFFEWQTHLGMNCCTGAYNVDLNAFNQTYAPAPAFDKTITDGANYWGSENAVGVLVAGALQYVYFNKYDGERGIRMIDTETEKAGIITDPLTGMEFNYYAKYDCETWTFKISTAHKLVALPTDIFSVGDDLAGVNYFYKFEISNP